jgi:hypothetical protein
MKRKMAILLLVTGLLAGVGAVSSPALTSGASTPQSGPTSTVVSTPQGNVLIKPSSGVTVSWLPTTQPVPATPGQTTTGQFWVTNQLPESIPITISPATAVPRNNGGLDILPGQDRSFSSVTYSPTQFVAPAGRTIPVTVTVTLPPSFGPGVYIVPALVQPHPSGNGNIRLETTISAIVTFIVPGGGSPRVVPRFVTPTRGVVPQTFHVPGLPLLQIGTSGSQSLRVTNVSRFSFYAITEVFSTQSPGGTAVLLGHVPQVQTDLRGSQELYFGSLHRDTPVQWSPQPIGIGVAHLLANVGTNHNGKYVVTTTTASVLVISPLWLLVFPVVLAALTLWLRRRNRRATRAPADDRRIRTTRGRLAQSAFALLLVLIVAALCFVCSPVIVAVGGVLVVAVEAGELWTGRAMERRVWATRHVRLLWPLLALLGAGVVVLIVSTLGTVAPSVATSLFAIGGLWVLMASFVTWWNEERPAPEGGSAGRSDQPDGSAAEELQPTSAP